MSTAILLGPHIPVRNDDGSYGRDPFSSVENPVAAAGNLIFQSRSGRILGNVFADYEIIPAWPSVPVSVWDYLNQKEDQF